MKRGRQLFSAGPLLLLVLLATALLVSALAAQTTETDGLLVMRSGDVLAGRITWAGDRYFVSAPGRQLGVQAADVLLVAKDLDDAYRQRRDALRATDIAGRQTLAAWCLRHELLDATSAEVDQLFTLDPRSETTRSLQRRLAARQQRQVADTAAAAATVKRPPSPKEPPRPNGSELDRLVASLPAGTVETFTTTIQPLLLNQCGTAGCHGPNSSANWRLAALDPRSPTTRATTLRNLQATLTQLDRSQPERSPLVTRPREAHGTAKGAIFTPRNAAQYQQLVRWVQQTVGQPTAAAAGRTTPDKPATSKSATSTSAAATTPGVDPYDPAPFNRRFFPPAAQEGQAANEPAAKTSVPRKPR